MSQVKKPRGVHVYGFNVKFFASLGAQPLQDMVEERVARIQAVCYAVFMSHTLTVRTDDNLHQALQQKAQVLGITISALVREILEDAVTERPLSARAGHLKGQLKLPSVRSDAWRQRIRERNWRS